MAPELVLQVALGQWLSARKSVALFHKSGFTDWTIRHGFYADMGGFRFQPCGWKSIPVNAKQLHYLVTRGYVDYPRISEVYIRDKNKVDGVLRVITLIQTLWFVVNVIIRARQNLTITAAELSTVAFVWLGIWTSLCWMSKPADVVQADTITSATSMENILREGGDAASRVYYYTPLDFASRAEWSWSRLWNHGLNLLRRLHWAAPPAERPVQRFQNTVIPIIEGRYYALWVVVSTAYFAIFLVAWKFSFPTQTECTLWRSASVMALSTAWVICFTLNWSCSWYPELKAKIRRAQPSSEDPSHHIRQPGYKNGAKGTKWFYALVTHFRNNSIMRDPALDTPVTLIVVTWIFGILYASSRIYIVIADVIELRSLPASAYKTVDWSSLWPHF